MGELKHAMKRNRKLNDAQVGGNVPADGGELSRIA